MGDTTSGWSSRSGELDARFAWLAIPLGMARGRGLVWRRGAWRLVIGSPSWAMFTGLDVESGWERDPVTGASWEGATKVPTGPGTTATTFDNPDPIMGLETDSVFSVTPGSVETDAASGSMATTGATVTVATNGPDTQARVVRASGWMDWVPWILLAAAAALVLRRRNE